MRQGFLLRIICFLMTVLVAVESVYFPLYEVDVVYAEQSGEDLTHFGGIFENYKIILFFCICLILCNFANKMKWMWMFSIGLMTAYPLISRIDRLEKLTIKLDSVIEIVSIRYTPLSNNRLLGLYSVLIFIVCTILFILEKKEQKRIEVLIERKRNEEELEKKKLDEEWRKSLFDEEIRLDKFPINRLDE